MALNAALIQARFEDIHESLKRLEAIRQQPREAFLENADLRDLASYRLLVAIEAAIQICYHVSAQVLHQAPSGYAECFALLSEGGIIPGTLGKRLQRMARFRNVLVHRYWDVDYSRVYDVLQHDLSDIREFMGFISALL